MFRTILCTVALAVAFTATHAEAGKFKIQFGGGGKHNHGKFHWNGHHNHHHHHVQKYHAPIVHRTCYYQVCYWHPAWGYKKHKVFCTLHEAKAFAYDLQYQGLYATVSHTYDPIYIPTPGHVSHAGSHGGVHNWLP